MASRQIRRPEHTRVIEIPPHARVTVDAGPDNEQQSITAGRLPIVVAPPGGEFRFNDKTLARLLHPRTTTVVSEPADVLQPDGLETEFEVNQTDDLRRYRWTSSPRRHDE